MRRLLAAHLPDAAALSLRAVPSPGTDNALWRVGEALVLRVPRRAEAVAPFLKEMRWLPQLGGLPLRVPEVVVSGRSDDLAHGVFGVLRWIGGDVAPADALADPTRAAIDLAAFLRALRQVPTQGAPAAGAANHYRGVPLHRMEARLHAALDALEDEIDGPAAHALWRASCAVPADGQGVWLHGDLKDDNLIAHDGALAGVIDWGLAAVGDPAADTMAAWTWCTPAARAAFRTALAPSEAEWCRARGWALYAAAIALSYYRTRGHADLCRLSRRTLRRLGVAPTGPL